MVETDQFRYELNSYDEPLKELRSALDLDNKAKKIEELEMHMEDQGFWNDPETSQKKLKELKALKDAFTNYNELEKLRDDARTFMEIADEENDTSIIPDIEELVNEFKNLFEKVRISTLYQKNMITAMPFLNLTREQVEQRAVIGLQCFSVCIQDGQRAKDIPLRHWITLTEMKQVSNLLQSR